MNKILMMLLFGALSTTGLVAMDNKKELNEKLLRAAAEGKLQEVESLLREHADPNYVYLSWAGSPGDDTPLIYAARYGHLDVVKRLLAAGALPDKMGEKGEMNALIHAVRNKHPEIVQTLIRAGADVNYSLESGDYSVLIAAVQNAKNLELVKMLLAAGALPNNTGKMGNTALIAAVKDYSSEQEEIVKTLIRAGADVNQESSVGITSFDFGGETTGNTALLIAAYKGDPVLIQILLDAGADVFHANSNNATALTIAAHYKPAILPILLDAITRLTPTEKELLKHWLVVDWRLRREGKGMPKDLKVPMVQAIYQSLANELRERVIRAGGMQALQKVSKKSGKSGTVQLLEKYRDLNFLEGLVRQQTVLFKAKQ